MSEANKEVIRRYYGEFEREATSTSSANSSATRISRRGCGAAPRLLQRVPRPPLQHRGVDRGGRHVFCRSIITGTHDGEIKGIAPTGRQISVDNGEVFRFDGGRFVGYWCQVDVAGMMRQLTEERPVEAAASATAGAS